MIHYIKPIRCRFTPAPNIKHNGIMIMTTNDITRAVTFEHLHNALHTGSTGAVVWTLDANGDLQTAHKLPARGIPSVLLDTHTGIVYLFEGAACIKRLARLTKMETQP